MPPANLELRLYNFVVPPGWDDVNSHSKPHDDLQDLLERNGLWGARFRYGSAVAKSTEERQLRADGVADSQKTTDGRIYLFETTDGRDNYCNADFFNGASLIVVYRVSKLEVHGPRTYTVNDRSALVALVRPTFNS